MLGQRLALVQDRQDADLGPETLRVGGHFRSVAEAAWNNKLYTTLALSEVGADVTNSATPAAA
jgi:hypothetical protein